MRFGGFYIQYVYTWICAFLVKTLAVNIFCVCISIFVGANFSSRPLEFDIFLWSDVVLEGPYLKNLVHGEGLRLQLKEKYVTMTDYSPYSK